MEHKSIAQALIHGKGFTFGDWGYYGPTSVQSPPFPFLLASMYEIFGADSPARWLASRCQPSLFCHHVHECHCRRRAGLVDLLAMTKTLGGTPLAGAHRCGFLVALWPTQIYAARFVQAVSLITCGLAAIIYPLLQSRSHWERLVTMGGIQFHRRPGYV